MANIQKTGGNSGSLFRKNKDLIKYGFIAVLIIMAFVFFRKQIAAMFNGITGAFGGAANIFGLGGTTASDTVHNTVASASDPFNPDYYHHQTTTIHTAAKVDADCRLLYDQLHWYSNPDFSQVMSVFKTIKNQAQVSQLCERFIQLYNSDLLTYLKGTFLLGFSNTDIADLINYCNALPKK